MGHRACLVGFLVAISFSAEAAAAPYVGVELGVLDSLQTNYRVEALRVQTVPTGNGLLGQTVTTTDTIYGTGFRVRYDKDADVDAIAGYDFGFLRLEGELGYKRAGIKSVTVDPLLLADLNTAPIGGVTSSSFSFPRRTTVLSAMVNALVSTNVSGRLRFYGGGGVGGARAKSLGDRERVFAYQFIAGVATPLSPNVELGLKYRYFETATLHLHSSATFSNAATGATSASMFSNSARFRSHSLLASLIYSFGAAPPPPPPVAMPAPPPPTPSPPATQTCSDGSVIEATATCPAPPPPPPPAAQRGERG